MRVLTLAVMCGMLAACGPSTASGEDAGSGARKSFVQWQKVSDGSFGWFNENADSVNVERCWKAVDHLNCLRIARLRHPNEMQVGLGELMIFGLVRKELSPDDILPETGYRCAIMDQTMSGTVESLTLSSGAHIESQVTGPFDQGSWSPDYVQKFVAKNDPSTPLVHFSCYAARQFLEHANDAAFLTTAIDRDTLSVQ